MGRGNRRTPPHYIWPHGCCHERLVSTARQSTCHWKSGQNGAILGRSIGSFSRVDQEPSWSRQHCYLGLGWRRNPLPDHWLRGWIGGDVAGCKRRRHVPWTLALECHRGGACGDGNIVTRRAWIKPTQLPIIEATRSCGRTGTSPTGRIKPLAVIDNGMRTEWWKIRRIGGHWQRYSRVSSAQWNRMECLVRSIDAKLSAAFRSLISTKSRSFILTH